jgi:protein-tyrosine phosphatase
MVCLGNICRSPMAEVILAKRFEEWGVSTARVESAGITALVGYPADPLAVEIMGERGLDLSPHRARQLTPDLARSFELILVMDAGQQRAVEAIDPSARGRVHRIGRMGGFDVPDPYRRGRAAFEQAASLIDRGLDDLEKIFWSERR